MVPHGSQEGSPERARRFLAATGFAALALLLVVSLSRGAPGGGPGTGHPPDGPAASGQSADTTVACRAEEVRMHTLLEKTIFQVDVLTLDVCFGSATDGRLDSLTAGRSYSDALADSVAGVALAASEVGARIEFLRDVGLDRFLGGIRENMGKAREADILTPAQYDSIWAGLPRWYSFLRDRGVRSGDLMLYRIQGDTLRTVFRTSDGRVLLDERYVGPERRLSVLGSYFAPGSDFREGLVRSAIRQEER